MTVANPIYDVVFKYLMEDMRIARTILSALLKEEVTNVTMRPHEYANEQRDSLSVFRIDFAAMVRGKDGADQLTLIELQKTWLETETLRFRQYLGVQYSNPNNIMPHSREGYAIPTVAVYILGHKVGDIEEPVIYVRQKSYDYNGIPLTKGIPNAFIDSLTHNSIIVQIPRLRGQINNRLDKVLSIFDQTHKAADNQQMLLLDENLYEGDADMQEILNRLTKAAASAEMRQRMNVEDEYFSIIEKRDTEILMRDKAIAEKNVQLQEKDERLQEKDEQLQEKDEQLQEKDEQLQEKDEQIKEKDVQLQEKDAALAKSIQLFKASGMSDASIAEALGIDIEDIKIFSNPSD